MKHKIAWHIEGDHNDDHVSHFLSIFYVYGTVGK